MRPPSALAGTTLFLLIAPGTLAGLVPWWISQWRMQSPQWSILPVRGAGVVLIAAGAAVLLDSFVRFALQGLGTPAPIAPPRRLVVTGLYRYVRNPMYVSVVALIVGQGLLWGDLRLLGYGTSIWLVFHAFVRFYEEPTLRVTFGAAYDDFCVHVPRWFPRLRPWTGH